MKIKNLKYILLYGIAIAISIFLLFFVVGCVWIGYEVKSQCQEAKREYSTSPTASKGQADCVDALIAALTDEKKSYRARNSSIWALGQLGDSRALSTLQSFYTGTIPPREPLDKTISQYELKKAIALTSGGYNMTAIFWRHTIH